MNLTDKDVNELISNKETFVVDVYGTWCNPCKFISPIIDKLSNKYQDMITIGKLDSDDNNETVSRFKVRGLPSVLFFKNGELVDTVVGATNEKTYDEKIQSILNE